MLKPKFKLLYENRDITVDVAPYVLHIEYSDHEHGQSDEIQIQFEDSNNLWQGNWYPSKGDTLTLQLGYENEKPAAWILEREDAIAQLRDLCEHFGDNEWSEDLHLADIIEKHLGKHLFYQIRDTKEKNHE